MTLFWESDDLIELIHTSNGLAKICTVERNVAYKMPALRNIGFSVGLVGGEASLPTSSLEIETC